MKIAIDATGIHYVGGGRSSILALLRSLITIDQENKYYVLLSEAEPFLTSRTGKVSQWISPFKNRFILRLWTQLRLSSTSHRLDLVHFTKNLGVAFIHAPTVVTVHDLTTLVHPELFPKFDVWYWQNIQKHTLNQARKIIAVSKNTAKDIITYYKVPEDRIQVIYNAIASHFAVATEQEITQTQLHYGISKKYFIHVGRIDSKKNLSFLVRTFNKFRERTRLDYQLVLVGEVYKKSPDTNLLPTIKNLGLQDHVLFTGAVPDEVLPALYSGAVAAVYPSFHEGFGLAQVEAMACGTPLIAHSAGAVSEVVGRSAIILETLDEKKFADTLAKVATDPQLHQDLGKRGLERAEAFKGDRIARETLQLYRNAVENNK
jgi:glycosyltransferase involved in cell wall biosynthesis